MKWIAHCLVALLLMLPGLPLGAAGRAGLGEWRVLWVPLDSRPVNTSEVQLFGAAAGADVQMPPEEALDWYASRRADPARLLAWLQRTTRPGDMLVLATNSLLTGGLIASRHPAHYAGVEKRIDALQSALQALPEGRRIAVHVLPRAWPTQFRPDGSPDPEYEALAGPLVERSELQHRLRLFGRPEDRERLEALDRAIPAGARARQDALIAQNQRILETLLRWAEAGLFDEVVVGLDDARPFGMATWLHRQVEADLHRRGLTGRVHAHHGADELGFLLLAREALQRDGVQPRMAVEYDRPEAAGTVPPYEGASLGRSVGQKLAFLGAANPPAGTGQRLFLYTSRGSHLLERMARAHHSGEAVALADLTGTAGRDRGLVERLSRWVPLDQVAYAGWNTASNAVGTALAMAAVRELHAQAGASEGQQLALDGFQAVRYAHDLIFQSYREEVDEWARSRSIDPARFGSGRQTMARLLRGTVLPEARAWLRRYLGGVITLADVDFPWDRTFEVAFRPFVTAGQEAERRP